MVAAGPINPTVLRLLVFRALYRGVERRDCERVTIGEEIKVKSGLMNRNTVLAELSLRGCGLVGKQAHSVGSKR